MKVTLNPKYQALQQFVEELPQHFAASGKTIQDKRNTIKTFEANGITLNVKRYRIPSFFNRIVYTFFRKTKTSKAYANAIEVQKRGFETPESVACIEEYRNGLLHYSYYVSLQCDFREEMRVYYFGPLNGNETILETFARYTAKLHEANICHLDYSPGNVLVKPNGNADSFLLVDINRMKFIPMSLKKGCQNLRRMFGNEEAYAFVARIYARERKLDPQECVRWMLYYSNRFLLWNRRKNKFKALCGRFFKTLS